MSDLAAVVRRAAARVPGPVATRSLEHVQRFTLNASRFAIDVALTDPDPTLGLLRVAPDETWCRRCGETVNTTGFCHRCGSQRGRPAIEILRPDEYYIAR
jgi:hypothetical protein